MTESKYAPGYYFLSDLQWTCICCWVVRKETKKKAYFLRRKCLKWDISFAKSEIGTEYKHGAKERHGEGWRQV